MHSGYLVHLSGLDLLARGLNPWRVMQQGKISCLTHCHFFAAIIHHYFDESSDEVSYQEADRAGQGTVN